MHSILIGDRVRWVSAEGTLRGEIINMIIAKNAKGDLVPWLSIEYIHNNKTKVCNLCATDDNLKMMKFQVNFRNAA